MKMGPHGSRPSCVQTRTARMNAKAAKVAKGAAPAAHLIATLAVTRGGQLCALRGLCVHRRGCDRSLTRPWGEQSVACSEQDAEDVLRVLRGGVTPRGAAGRTRYWPPDPGAAS